MKYQTFLVKTENEKEAVMRLPVNVHGGITPKGFKIVRSRFNDGLRYALNLEAFSSGRDLAAAVTKYYKNEM